MDTYIEIKTLLTKLFMIPSMKSKKNYKGIISNL